VQTKIIYVNGRNLLDEVGLSTATYTVVSPNTFKLFQPLIFIKNILISSSQPENSCLNAVNSKLNSIDSDKFCTNTASNFYSLPVCDSSKTKVVQAQCAYGSGVPDDYIKCKTLKEQF